MLKITNTLSKQKEEFKPITKDLVTFYHCGPTVYWTQHIGNMRAMVMADIVRRTFEYLGYKVNMTRNYTDVGHLTSDADEGEDKMAKATQRESLSPQEIANKYIKEFDNDLKLLNIETPEQRPKATETIPESIAMVQAILDNGYAYTTDLAIYFDVTKVDNYGELRGQILEDQEAGQGKGSVVDINKKHSADFAIWFFKAGAHQDAIQTWPSPFTSSLVANGEGFPGWHLECSVMAKKFLGETIDLHMGGIEHIPIHHTNEIAQSEAANGKPFVNYWLHNEHLLVDGSKMAKSEGTSYTLQDIIKKGFNPLVLRYFFLNAHYRSQQNFTWEALESAKTTLNKLYDRVADMAEAKIGSSYAKATADACAEYEEKFQSALEDDFNTPQALAVMWDLLKSDNPENCKKASLLKFDKVLGLGLVGIKKEELNFSEEVKALIKAREEARAAKEFDKADDLRKQIEDQGFDVEDTPMGQQLKRIKL